MSHLNKFLFTFFLGLSIVLASCGGNNKEEDPEPGTTTELELTIVDEAGRLQSDVLVKLYRTDDDMDHGTNLVASNTSDSKGKVTFTGLESAYYYFRATKDTKSNYWGGPEKTVSPLTSREKTSMTVLIE